MKSAALEEIQQVLEEEVNGPLGDLEEILTPFQLVYDFFVQKVKNVKEAWRIIRTG